MMKYQKYNGQIPEGEWWQGDCVRRNNMNEVTGVIEESGSEQGEWEMMVKR